MSESESDSDHRDQSPEEQEEEATPEEKSTIRSKLSSMSFEDLQTLKEKIGSKVYNKTVLGVTKKSKHQPVMKRANKNRPREMSAKIRPRPERLRSSHKNKNLPRDPRFDPLCGSYDNATFKQNFKFVNDIRKGEKAKLEKELKKTEDVEEKRKIRFVLQRLNNQIREHERTELEEQKKNEEKREIKDRLRRGEKPVYENKSVKRVKNLINKYEELKKTNKLQKYMEKKSRKMAAKERRTLEKFS